jgi:hypothetical protein
MLKICVLARWHSRETQLGTGEVYEVFELSMAPRLKVFTLKLVRPRISDGPMAPMKTVGRQWAKQGRCIVRSAMLKIVNSNRLWLSNDATRRKPLLWAPGRD